jgi:hypothetical protein
MTTHDIRRFTTSVLIVALSGFWILNTTGTAVAWAGKGDNPKNDTVIVGQLTTTGVVTINEKKAINGTSVFTNSRIKVDCAKGSKAIVNLGRLGQIELEPGAQMTLRFSAGQITGDLTDGNITVKAPAGVKVSIATRDGVAATSGNDSAVVPVKAQRGVRCVPMVISSTSSAIGMGPLAGVLAGIGGAGAIGAAAAGGDNNASNTVP